MLPQLWIFDTYSIMLLIGVSVCLFLFSLYSKKNNMDSKYKYDLLLLACFSVMTGIIFASLFQMLFDALKSGDISPFSMTFFGGLTGGVIFFILGYKFYIKKKYNQANFIDDIMIIAPSCITIAHGFGRIGCFLAGCCYGIETNSILGVTFPGMNHAVYPTQLFEAIYLFIISLILFILAYKYKFKYTLPLYLILYGMFRFSIEFIRGDDRGAFFLSLSPSQWFSIISIVISLVLTIYLVFKNKNNYKKLDC